MTSQTPEKTETSKQFWDKVRARIAFYRNNPAARRYAHLAKNHRDVEMLVGLSTPLAPLVPAKGKVKTHIAHKRKTLMTRQDGKCAYCDKPFSSTNLATFDHIRPKSRGGTGHIENLLLACSPCNQLKGNMATYKEAKRKSELYMAFADMLKEKGYLQ